MSMRRHPLILTATLTSFALVAGCSGPIDFDMRGKLGGSVDTSQAALQATENRPRPDDRGVISYPNFQVAVARRNDTVADVASRVGLPAAELATFNGMRPEDTLRPNEIVALPRRVSEPSPATGAATTGPIRPASQVDVTTLASAAIERAPATTPAASSTTAPLAAQSGIEPVRHKVARGETAFTIARLYNVTPRALAEWNGLDREFSLREGQFLLIPVALPPERPQDAGASDTDRVTVPGTGSPTPAPPSATKPLPAETPPPVAPAKAPVSVVKEPVAEPAAPKPPAADIGQAATKPSGEMLMPTTGKIIREYAKGRNEGIDIGAPAGAPVKAAASGQVAAITRNDDNVQIVVIRHPDDLLTIYTHLDGLTISKGDAVSRGQTIGKVRVGQPSFLHFEIRQGFESVDPMLFLQ